MFFTLPTSLQVELFTKWLPLEAIGNLDSAVCAGEVRDESCVFKNFGIQSIQFMKWVPIRSVKLLRAALARNAPENVLPNYFSATGRWIETVSISELQDTGVLLEVAACCPNLKKLILRHADFSSVNVTAVLMNCPHLEHLDLAGAINVSAETIKCINYFGSTLHTIDFSGCFFEGTLDGTTLRANRTVHKLVAKSQGEGGFLIPFIRHCHALNDLTVGGICFADVLLILAGCRSIRIMAVEMQIDGLATSEQVDRLIPLAQGLSRLHMCSSARSSIFSDHSLVRIVQACHNLEVFWAYRGNDDIFRRVCGDCKTLPTTNTSRLQSLHVLTIEPGTLYSILGVCTGLRDLRIVSCLNWDASENVASAFAAICKSKVDRLLLRNCQSLPSSCFPLLKCLKRLVVCDANLLTDSAVCEFARNNPHLAK